MGVNLKIFHLMRKTLGKKVKDSSQVKVDDPYLVVVGDGDAAVVVVVATHPHTLGGRLPRVTTHIA